MSLKRALESRSFQKGHYRSTRYRELHWEFHKRGRDKSTLERTHRWDIVLLQSAPSTAIRKYRGHLLRVDRVGVTKNIIECLS